MADSKEATRLAKEAKLRVSESEAQVEKFVEVLRRFLQRNLAPILQDLQGGKVTAKEAAKSLGGLESALEDAGLKERFAKLKEMFHAEYEAVTQEFRDTTGKAALLSDFTRKNLQALVDERLDMASTYITDYVGDVRGAVLDSVVAGVAVNPLDILSTAEGRNFANLATEINTTLMAYQRIVHFEKADKAGIDKFLYVGPDDDITRPFCAEHVDQIFTRDEIDAMDNGTDLPVSIYCGGYNCRHHWRPVSDELAKEIEDANNGQN